MRWGCRPVDRVDADRAAMLALPPVAPLTGLALAVRLPRDHYVRLDSNDYSVHPVAVGRRVEVRADLETVTVTMAEREVARHLRCWAKHQSITDPEHANAAAAMRSALVDHRAPVDAVERRSLTEYDAAFGLDEQVA